MSSVICLGWLYLVFVCLGFVVVVNCLSRVCFVLQNRVGISSIFAWKMTLIFGKKSFQF